MFRKTLFAGCAIFEPRRSGVDHNGRCLDLAGRAVRCERCGEPDFVDAVHDGAPAAVLGIPGIAEGPGRGGNRHIVSNHNPGAVQDLQLHLAGVGHLIAGHGAFQLAVAVGRNYLRGGIDSLNDRLAHDEIKRDRVAASVAAAVLGRKSQRPSTLTAERIPPAEHIILNLSSTAGDGDPLCRIVSLPASKR